MMLEPTLGHDDAAAAIDAIREELAARGRTAVIAVADPHGELIALARLDGAPVSSVAVATAKARTAARLRRPTRVLGEQIRTRGIAVSYYADPQLTAFGGGVPVWSGRQVVGAIAVSGLSDQEDEELAALGIARMPTPGLSAAAA
ncbi:MAG: heme-binding protein [Burkholderiales bacterium]